jgi:hypothetical protein
VNIWSSEIRWNFCGSSYAVNGNNPVMNELGEQTNSRMEIENNANCEVSFYKIVVI